LELAQVVVALAVLPAGEADRARAPGFEAAEQFLVARAGVRQLAGGGDDGDVGVAPAAQLHEALEDAAPHLLVLGPADRDDPATFFALGDPAWTHCGADSSCRSPRPVAPGPRRHAGAVATRPDGRRGGQNSIIRRAGRRRRPNRRRVRPSPHGSRSAHTSGRAPVRGWRRAPRAGARRGWPPRSPSTTR